MKTTIFVVIFMSVLSTHILAADVFNLESIREQVLKTNTEYALAQLEVEIAQLQLTNAQAEHLRQASIVSVRQAENNLLAADRILTDIASRIMVEAERRYYNVLSIIEQVELATQGEGQAQENFRIIKVRYNEGLATPMDITRAEQEQLQAINLLQSRKGQLEIARLRLLEVLGLPLDTQFNVDDQEFQFTPVEISRERILQQLKEHNPDLLQLADQLDVARLEEKTSLSGFTAPLIQALTTLKRKTLEIQYNQLKNGIYLQVLELGNNLQGLEASYIASLKEVDIAKENYRIVLLRFEDGLELPSSVIDAQLNLNRANQQGIKALFDYNIAKSHVKHLIGVE